MLHRYVLFTVNMTHLLRTTLLLWLNAGQQRYV